MKVTFLREKNYLTMHRPYKVYVDNQFIDYIEPSEKCKSIEVSDVSKHLKVMVNNFSSNVVSLEAYSKGAITISITSQIQNGLFIFIAVTFLGSSILKLLGFMSNNHLYLAFLIPSVILVYWQTVGRDNYLRLTKK